MNINDIDRFQGWFIQIMTNKRKVLFEHTILIFTYPSGLNMFNCWIHAILLDPSVFNMLFYWFYTKCVSTRKSFMSNLSTYEKKSKNQSSKNKPSPKNYTCRTNKKTWSIHELSMNGGHYLIKVPNICKWKIYKQDFREFVPTMPHSVSRLIFYWPCPNKSCS